MIAKGAKPQSPLMRGSFVDMHVDFQLLAESSARQRDGPSWIAYRSARRFGQAI
jgi:hypothetical protein